MPDRNTPNAKGKTLMDYIPLAMQKLGISAPQEPATVAEIATVPAEPAIGKKQITEAIATLKK